MHDIPYCSALVLKVASRCNINCTYCYMYGFEDKSYLQQPRFMSEDTMKSIIIKVNEHCIKHSLKRFFFIFHGGEPLLAKKDFYINFIELSKSIIKGGVTLYYSVQTNGILLDDEWCSIFRKYNVRVGISVDGPQRIHDKHRVDHQGKGTFSQVEKGIDILRSNGLSCTSKLLCVINVDSDPLELYDFFKSTGIKNMDFLFPDSNYEYFSRDYLESACTKYADWLIKIFDKWIIDEKNISRLEIRRFNNAIGLILGQRTSSDEMGLEDNNVLVIETDGGIEAIDSLKICGDSFTKENMNISRNSIDEALTSKLAKLYYKSHKNLCKICSQCVVKEVCGGGNIVHRYRKSNAFDNPSVYCKDLAKIYQHMRNSVHKLLVNYDLIQE